MGIFDFWKKRKKEAVKQKPLSKKKAKKDELSVEYGIAYILVGYKTEASPWFEMSEEKVAEMIKKADDYFEKNKLYTSVQIQQGGMALDFNVWLFGKWEQKVVEKTIVNGKEVLIEA